MLNELINNQEALTNIIMALIVSFTGTGIFGLMVKVGINKGYKMAKEKIEESTKANKISQTRADRLIEHLEIETKAANDNADRLNKKLEEVMERQLTSDKAICDLAESIKTRDTKIAAMLEKELTDSEEE